MVIPVTVNDEISVPNEPVEQKDTTAKSSKHKKDTNKSEELSDEELERRRKELLQQLHADPEESE